MSRSNDHHVVRLLDTPPTDDINHYSTEVTQRPWEDCYQRIIVVLNEGFAEYEQALSIARYERHDALTEKRAAEDKLEELRGELEKTRGRHRDELFAQQKANFSAYEMVQTLLKTLQKRAKTDSAGAAPIPTTWFEKRVPPEFAGLVDFIGHTENDNYQRFIDKVTSDYHRYMSGVTARRSMAFFENEFDEWLREPASEGKATVCSKNEEKTTLLEQSSKTVASEAGNAHGASPANVKTSKIEPSPTPMGKGSAKRALSPSTKARWAKAPPFIPGAPLHLG